MTTTAPLTITAVILNWNGRAYLESCLPALLAQSYPVERIVLVDNGSTDDSVTYVEREFPTVVVLANGGNVGFAAGNNLVLRHLTTGAALLVNPDVILSPGCLGALVEALTSVPSVAIAGAKLWYPGGQQLQHAGGYITPPQAMPGHYGGGERDTGQHDAARDVDYVIGAVMLIRRAALEQIGLFDEGYFLYYEETDLCARARAAGYRVRYEPRATAVHVESAVAGRGSFAYFQRFHTGRWRYLLKHYSGDELLAQTVPAEAAWLARIDEHERRAVSLAYLATRHALENIRLARDANDPLPDETWAALDVALDALRQRARQRPHEESALGRLAAAAVVVERPFVSNVPLLGPIIARFRTAWNNVASRWYIHHVVEQQNTFNQLAVRQLETYEMELCEQLQLLEEQVVEQETLRRRVQELAAQVADLRRRMATSSREGSESGSSPSPDATARQPAPPATRERS